MRHEEGPLCRDSEVHKAVDGQHAEEVRYDEAVDDIQQGRTADLKTL